MIEWLQTAGIAMTFLGATIGSYQLARIRQAIDGPLLRNNDLGSIIVEHILFGALWLVLLFGVVLLNMVSDLLRPHWSLVSLGLIVLIMLAVWGFVIRTHLWYRAGGRA